MLDVTNVRKHFGGFVAVDNVSLHIGKGETHAIIGPNGAGKTTLFDLISGVLSPDQGRVSFAGRELTRLRPHEIVRVGMARSFQRVNIFPRKTTFENVRIAIIAREYLHFSLFRPAGRLFIDEVESLLDLVGLSADANARAGDLSYGRQKQLELAVVLAAKPRMLLLDEPTAGMSVSETHASIRLIKEIVASQGLTLLFTEHDMDVVFGIADRISVLHHGALIASGKPAEVRENPEVKSVYLGHGD